MLKLLVINKLVNQRFPQPSPSTSGCSPPDWGCDVASVWLPLTMPPCVIAAPGVPENTPDRGCSVVVLPDPPLVPEDSLSALVLEKETDLWITQ